MLRWCSNILATCCKMKVSQLCLTLWDPRDCSLPGPSVRGILQARILDWVAFPFTRGIFTTQGSNSGLLHYIQILYHLSHQGSPLDASEGVSESRSVVSDSLWSHGLYMSMAFSRPAYWSRQPFPSPGDLPKPGIEFRSSALQADSLPSEPPGKPGDIYS